MTSRVRNGQINVNRENLPTLKGKLVPVPNKPKALEEIGNKIKDQSVLPGKTRGIALQPHKPVMKDEVSQLAKKVEELTAVPKESLVKHSALEKFKAESEAISYSASLLVVDIDKDHYRDQTFIGAYAADIFAYLKRLELQYPIKKDYLNRHGHLTPRMRSIVVDWLVEVQGQFNLLQETLFLAITIVDRYLQKYPFTEKKKLQLVGATAMFVSSKYEETYPPSVSDFEQICCSQYSKEDFLNMESRILRVLGFFMGFPLSVHFLRRYAKVVSPEEEIYTLAKYCQELCIMEYELCHYRPSLIASASLFVAQWLCDQPHPIWTDDLVYYSGYSCDKVVVLAKELLNVLLKVTTSKFQAVKEKYSSKQFFRVSSLPVLSEPTLKKKLATLK